MPRKAQGLTAAKVRTAKPGRYGDGCGLYLLVKPTGMRSWVFRYTINKKLRDMGLGPAGTSAADVSLAEARDRAAVLIRLVRSGIDPLEQRDTERAASRAAAQEAVIRAITFRKCAETYIEAHKAGWRNAKHEQQWTNTLDTYAHPHFGDVPVSAVETEHVLASLQPIWTLKPETAARVRGRVESVLDYARSRHWRDGENPARWRGHLDNLLPARSKVAKVEHHAALSYLVIGAFMVLLKLQEGLASRALEFTILTAARTGETLGATWDEIDFNNAVWTIPADRMKASREHRVPLSDAALGLLRELHKARSGDHLFPGQRTKKPLSNMAMLMVLRRMKRDDLTAHGFRSTFRDWAAERTTFAREVAEAALAHTLEDKVEAAYRRGDLFEKRRKLMQAWGSYCLRPAGPAKVIALEARA